MNQKSIKIASCESVSLPCGLGNKPFSIGATLFNDMIEIHKTTVRSKTRIYRIWKGMRGRVNNQNADHYKYYGGKGITVCIEWEDFIIFKKWAMRNGYDDTLTIDRIDCNGNYEPSNCRWVTKKVNNQNKIFRDDYGIFPKTKGFYVQLTIDDIYYCGGYSTNINESRKFRDELLRKVKYNGLKPKDIKRKVRSRDKKTGQIIWI